MTGPNVKTLQQQYDEALPEPYGTMVLETDLSDTLQREGLMDEVFKDTRLELDEKLALVLCLGRMTGSEISREN